MAADGSIVIETKVDNSGIKSGLKDINSGLNKFKSTAAKIMTGIGVGLLAKKIVGAASAIENLTAAFTPLTGGAENAKKMIAALNRTAATTPFQIEDIGKAAKQLLPILGNDVEKVTSTFRMLGDTAGGNAQKLDSITRGYSKAMLKGKVDMESLNMIAEAGVPIYTELANSMGVSVSEMMEMSSKGKIMDTDLTNAFKNMTKEGGVFFGGMEVASKTLSGKFSTFQDNVNLLAAVLGNALLPGLKSFLDVSTQVVSKLTGWIKEGDNLSKTLEVLGFVLAGVTAGMIAFLVIFKSAAAVHAMATAFRAMTAAMAANPIGLIAVAITAILIPALIWLIKNWDWVSVYISSWIAKTKQGFILLAGIMKEKFITAVNSIKIGMVSLAQTIANSVIDKVKSLIGTLAKIPGSIGAPFKKALKFVEGMQDGLNDLINTTKEEAKLAILVGKEKRLEAEKNFILQMGLIDKEKQERLAAIAELKRLNDKEIAEAKAKVGEISKIKLKAPKDAIGTWLKKQGISKLKEGTKAYELAIEKFGKEAVDAFMKSQEDELSKGKEIFDKFKEYFMNVGAVIQKGIGVITKISSGFVTAFKNTFNGIFDVIKGLAEFDPKEIFDNFKEILDGLTNFFTQDIGNTAIFIEKGMDLFSSFLDGMIKALPSILKSVPNLINSVIEKFGENKDRWAEQISEIIVSISKVLLLELPKVLGLFGNIFIGMLETAKKDFPKILPAIKEAIVSILKLMGKMLPEMLGIMSEAVTEIANYLFGDSQIVDAFFDVIMNILKVVVDNLPGAISIFIKFILQVVNAILSRTHMLTALFIKIIGSIIKAVLDNLPELIKTFIHLIIVIVEALVKYIPLIIDMFIALIPDIIAAVILLLPTLIEAFFSIIMSLVTVTIENLPLLISAFIAFIPQMVKAIYDNRYKIVNAFWEAGVNIMEGMINGIGSVDFWQGIGSIFTDMVDDVKDFFGIHSPSTLFEGFGENIIQGMINGITEKGDELLDAAKGVFGAVGDVAKNAVSGVSAGFGNIGNVLSGKTSVADGFSNGFAIAKKTVNKVGSSIRSGVEKAGKAIKDFFRFENGGIVPGSSTTGDNVPVRVNSGEMILNKSQQSKLFAMANGKGMKSIMNGLNGGYSTPTTTSSSTSQPISIQSTVTGIVEVDGRVLGKIAFENMDRNVRATYGNV